MKKYLLFLAVWLALPLVTGEAHADLAHVRELLQQRQTFDAFEELLDLAPKGDPEAQYLLAGMYHWGDIGAANFKKALYWYERAANQGHGDAMLGLAILYAQDDSIPLDRPQAYRWLILAERYLTDAKARQSGQELRDSLAAKMTADEITAAEMAATSFQPRSEKAP